MINKTELNKKFSALQSSSINCGGTWEIRVLEKRNSNDKAISVLTDEFKKNAKYDNFESHKEFSDKGGWNPEEQRLTKNLDLIELKNWENYFEQRIEHWSNFELISKDEMTLRFNQELKFRSKLNA
ncbi:MAG: hypothetical protein U5N85_17510 [Arcicella sp.]|nr:hypothetical protein [Arcicella sp.]